MASQESSTPTVVHLSTPLTWRGGEQQLWYLYHELKSSPINQLIACPNSGKLAQRCIEKSLNFVPIANQGSISLRNAARLKSICKQHQADIIHAHDAHALTTAVLASRLFGNKTAIVASRRVNYPINGRLSKYKYNDKTVKKILCVSEAVYQVVAPIIKDTAKITTVHSGIDLNKFNLTTKTRYLREEFHIPDDQVLIGNAAALTEQKDYPTFINTAKLIIDRGIKATFVIIGTGPNREQLQQQVTALGLDHHIIFAGFRANITTLLPEFDLLLSTSINEGLGTTVLEAMTAEVPIVATEAGGIGEMIEHQVSGMLVPPGNPETLANCLEQLIHNPTLRQQFINQASQKVKQFDKAITAQKTLVNYLSVCDQAH